MDIISSLESLRKIVKHKDKYAFADFTGEKMPDIVDSTFRIFTPHKLDRHRIDNGKGDVKFDMYQDTLLDYPSIIKSKLGGTWESYNKILSAQVSFCDFHCWHCYVPDELLRGGSNINYLKPIELVEQFLVCKNDKKKESLGSQVLRITGGEPFLAPDLILECLEYLHEKRLDDEIFIWSETNLSPFLKDESQKVLCENWLGDQGKSLSEFAKFKNFALHPCLHGTTSLNFAQTTLGKEEYFDQLIDTLRLLVDARIDIYPTISSNTSPSTEINDLFFKLKKINPQLPLRFALIQFNFENYPPIDERLSKSNRQGIIYGKDAMITKWNTLLKENYNLNYGEMPRCKVQLYGETK